ncbi:MAG: hypothetical protein E7165_03875 [Firmicutes bacterium]|nr:hypothetical protein [Bacillota bacterium]
MAIHCVNPNTIGSEAEEILTVVEQQGGRFLENFENVIRNLDSHWKGTDAVKNLGDLASVYSALTLLIQNVESLIVDLNNNEVLPLQRHIYYGGGDCVIGNELSERFKSRDPHITVQTEGTESWTAPEIIADAETFKEFPSEFNSFIEALTGAKETLLANWLEGANREAVVTAFKTFDEHVLEFKEQLKTVKENLTIVADYKKQLF